MDAKTTDAISLRLNTLSTEALVACKSQVRGIYSSGDHREIIPEFMVRGAVRAVEDSALRLVADAVVQVSALSVAPDAFMMIDAAVAAHLSAMEGVVEQGQGVPLQPAALKAAGDRYDAVRHRIVRVLENHRSRFVETKNKGGRPQSWDWEEVLIHVAAIANTPDGLPSGEGAQARIEEIIQSWFIRTTGAAPSESEVRKRASAVMKRLKTSSRPFPADTRANP